MTKLKIELKDNQRLFLNWVLLWKYSEMPLLFYTKIATAMSDGFYTDGGETQRQFNNLRSEYMQEYKEYEDGIAKMTYLTVK